MSGPIHYDACFYIIFVCSPNLTWRDVQYLIVYTSSARKLAAESWTLNGANLSVSHKFGFGVVDAEAMVNRARHWINVPPQVLINIPNNT